MAATGRLTRTFYPRWMTSSKSSEVNVYPAQEVLGDNIISSKSHDEPQTSTPTVHKLRDILKTSVLTMSKQMLSNQTSWTSRKAASGTESHMVGPDQSLADAMSEWHSSVNQYYGLAPNTSNWVETSQATNESTTPVANKKAASKISKRAKIVEARINRLSMADTERKMKSLTVNAMAVGISTISRMARLRELTEHVKVNPSCRLLAINQGVIPFLTNLQRDANRSARGPDNRKLSGIISETLAVLGHTPRVNSRGVKILTIDGGGTRGLVAIETLKQLEILCRAPIHTLFDYICGVSTGGLLAILVGTMKLPLDRCEAVYKECSQRIFTRNTMAGTANLLTRHCYYDMAVWEKILKDEIGADRTMLSTTREGSPRVGLVSTVISGVPYNYVFRNYNHSISSTSQYPGTCDANVWEAIRASAAAPGFFEDFKIGEHVHQDGGVLNNNPTAIALHEVKALWPDEQVQCVVSLGNGRYEPDSVSKVDEVSSLRHKVGAFIHSATNTEGVHTVLSDLLPAETYYRFNPYVSEEFMLNEIQEEKLQLMQFDTQMYLRRNASKLNKTGQQLSLTRSPQQKIRDWLTDKYQKQL